MINHSWTLRGGKVFTPSPFALFGIVNLTPDSFSDGGKYFTPQDALTHAQSLWEQGAQILDLGAESSRPGASPLSGMEEWQRLAPTLSSLLTWCTSKADDAPYVSIDTYHAETAKAALEAGAHIINDISACRFEPAMLDIIAQYKPGYVLMHSFARPQFMQENIQEGNILDTLLHFFEQQLHRFTAAGLPEEHIMLDMGIGFGKSHEQNIEILQNMHLFTQFGRPILAAISMKSVLHTFLHVSAQDEEARKSATSVATSLLALQGIAYHRVHHVRPCVQALHMAQLLMPKYVSPVKDSYV